jgi:hypothetical protein
MTEVKGGITSASWDVYYKFNALSSSEIALQSLLRV